MAILYRKSTNSTIRLMQSLSIGVSLFVGCSQGFAQVMFTGDFESGLTPSTSHTYKVSAYDAVPNTRAQSTSANATTQAASSLSAGWTISQNYDGQTIGQRCQNWGSSQSIVTNIKSYSGGQSCLNRIKAGATAFGYWGGIINFPTNLVKGDEIWIRLRTYMPAGFNYDSTSGGNRLKFLRVRTPVGFNDWYINPTSGSDPEPFRFIYEGAQQWTRVGNQSDKPQFGQWETYEYYLKMDDVSAAQGGQARVRMWKNGTLLKDIADRITLKTPSTQANALYIFTYWNGGSPQTQQMYIDDLVITTQRPANLDAFGNPYVGTGGTPPSFDPPSAPIAQ